MSFCSLCVCFVVIINILVVCWSSGEFKHDSRGEQISRMGSYELIKFAIEYTDIKRTNGYDSLTFEYDNDSYMMNLELNKMLVASNVKQTQSGDDVGDHDENGYFTSLTKSCHYHADVFKNDILVGRGSISICDKRGVWGQLRIGLYEENEDNMDVLVIAPARYYFDYEYHKSDDKFHHVSHQHLIYSESNFNTTGFPKRGISRAHTNPPGQKQSGQRKSAGIGQPSQLQRQRTIRQKHGNRDHLAQRNLLSTFNGGRNLVEMYILTDESEYLEYYDQSGSNWKQELTATMFDYVNSVSEIYSSTNFGSSIGTILIRLKELEIAKNWNGRFASLYPLCYKDKGDDPYNCEKEVDGVYYMTQFEEYILNYKDLYSLDSFQLFTKFAINGAAGLGNWGVMCSKSTYIGETSSGLISDKTDWGFFYNSVTLAHELGHNFWMSHEENKKIMGSGEVAKFTNTNVAEVKRLFNGKGDFEIDGMLCLGDFSCDNGCSITSEWYNDGSYCDCSGCEDEDFCDCPNGGCTSSCGEYVGGSCWSGRTTGDDDDNLVFNINETDVSHDFGDDIRVLEGSSDGSDGSGSGSDISGLGIGLIVSGVVVFVIVGVILTVVLIRKCRLDKRINEYKQAQEGEGETQLGYEPPVAK